MNRSEILAELGLTEWRLRAFPTEWSAADGHSDGTSMAGDGSAPGATAAPTRLGNSATPESPPVSTLIHLPSAKDRSVPTSSAGVDGDRSPLPDSDSWEQLEADISACRLCGLCERRQNPVPGIGDRSPAQWMVVGEGPGAEEDARGEPFVGQAGKLLDAMLAAIKRSRDGGAFIANAVKCRPPGNRTPTPEEIVACRPFLQRQMHLLQPGLVLVLGRSAVHSVLGVDAPLGPLRGRVHESPLNRAPVVVSYHPAYLLRNLGDKAKAWADLCLARRTLPQAHADSAG